MSKIINKKEPNTLYFIAGPIAAGKSTFMENRLYNSMLTDANFFDHDREKLMIKLYAPEEKNIIKSLTVEKALVNAFKDSLQNNKDFIMQVHFTTEQLPIINGYIHKYGNKFNLESHFITVNNVDILKTRAEIREHLGGHSSEIKSIEKTYKQSYKNFVTYLSKFKKATVWDNSLEYGINKMLPQFIYENGILAFESPSITPFAKSLLDFALETMENIKPKKNETGIGLKKSFLMTTTNNIQLKGSETLAKIFEERRSLIRQINPATLLIDEFGYKINHSSTTARNPVLEGKAGTFVVYMDHLHPGEYRLMKSGNSFNSDIYNFLFQYENANFGFPKSFDKNFMETVWEKLSGYNPSLKTSNLINSEYKRMGVADLSYIPLIQNDYLTSRGLKQSILSNDKYIDAFGNKILYTKDANFLNTALLYKDRNNELVTIESINHSPKQSYRAFAANSEIGEGLVKSNILPGAKNMVIGESFIDTVSYSILKSENMTQSFDVGFGGNLKNAQVGHIQYLIETYKPEKIFLINDRDAAGWNYDLKLIAALGPVLGNESNPKIAINLSKERDDKGQNTNYDIVQIRTVADLKDFDKNEVNNYLHQIKETIEKARIEAQILDMKVDTKFEKGVLSFKFFHQEHYLHRLTNALKGILDPNDKFVVDKVEGKTKEGVMFKDYNERLTYKLDLPKEKRVANFNPFKERSKEEMKPLLEKVKEQALRLKEIDKQNNLEENIQKKSVNKDWRDNDALDGQYKEQDNIDRMLDRAAYNNFEPYSSLDFE
jgi:predicted ABC-type ATPase